MSVKVYTKNMCGYCVQAKNFLKSKNIDFEEVNIESVPEAREFVINEGHRTMPQIYVDGKSIGGYQQLIEYDVSKLS
jgi:glutaredoxin 3|tara:strand:- start:21 stop:251 length:231 start_codon:yes stop_codon:yes gene_type:complete